MRPTRTRRSTKEPVLKKGREPFFQKKTAQPFFSTAGQTIQPKLTIGKPGDAFEQEADAMADNVVNQPTSPSIQPKEEPIIQRQEAGMEDEELQAKPDLMAMEDEEELQAKPNLMAMEDEEELQAKPDSGHPSHQATPALSTRLQQSKGRGSNLPRQTQAEMSTAFGKSFSSVRIHTDADAARMSKTLRAQAFTHGKDIYFNQGKFNPTSKSGKHLLAHELTHVVQQNKG